MGTAATKRQANISAPVGSGHKPARIGDVSWERMIRAVEKVRERLRRAVAALEAARIPYAVAGGNAVAAWVSRVDEAAVRNTQDVDILLRRSDLPAATEALSKAGFIYRHAKSLDMFLDGPEAKARDAVHIVFAAEKVRSESLTASPDINESEATAAFRLVTLEALVRMKLTAFRDKDRTHLRDLIDVELLDSTWVKRLPTELAVRLQTLLDTPEG
jgi:Nucleotidyl transferase AbiEii toxin, Type IV TA system